MLDTILGYSYDALYFTAVAVAVAFWVFLGALSYHVFLVHHRRCWAPDRKDEISFVLTAMVMGPIGLMINVVQVILQAFVDLIFWAMKDPSSKGE